MNLPGVSVVVSAAFVVVSDMRYDSYVRKLSEIYGNGIVIANDYDTVTSTTSGI